MKFFQTQSILRNLEYVIGKTKSTIQNGVKLRGVVTGKGVHNQQGSVVKGEMAMEGWVSERIPPKDGMEQTYSDCQLKKECRPGSLRADLCQARRRDEYLGEIILPRC